MHKMQSAHLRAARSALRDPCCRLSTLTESQPGLPPSGLQFSLSWFFHLAFYNQQLGWPRSSPQRGALCLAV